MANKLLQKILVSSKIIKIKSASKQKMKEIDNTILINSKKGGLQKNTQPCILLIEKWNVIFKYFERFLIKTQLARKDCI